jgi:hypothetical protein
LSVPYGVQLDGSVVVVLVVVVVVVLGTGIVGQGAMQNPVGPEFVRTSPQTLPG